MVMLQRRRLSADDDIQLTFGIFTTLLALLTLCAAINLGAKCFKLRRKFKKKQSHDPECQSCPKLWPTAKIPEGKEPQVEWVNPKLGRAAGALPEKLASSVREHAVPRPHTYLKLTWTSQELEHVYVE